MRFNAPIQLDDEALDELKTLLDEGIRPDDEVVREYKAQTIISLIEGEGSSTNESGLTL